MRHTSIIADTTTIWHELHPNKKKTIIAIHGFRGTHHGLEKIAQNLENYRVIIPDLPGFGESTPLARSDSLDDYVEWLHEFIAQIVKKEPVVLLSHSFGTIVAGAYAAQYPDTLTKLIMINPIADHHKSLFDIGYRMTQLFYTIGKLLPGKIGEAWLRNRLCVNIMSLVLTKTHDQTIRRFVYEQHRKYFGSFANKQVVLAAFRLSTQHSVKQYATRIVTPSLLIVGEDDAVAPLTTQTSVVALIPTHSLETIPKLGHLLPYEAPAKVADLVDQFID